MSTQNFPVVKLFASWVIFDGIPERSLKKVDFEKKTADVIKA